MGDEQRSFCPHLRTRDHGCGLGYDRPHQGLKAFVVDAQGEQRGYGRLYLVPLVGEPLESLQLGRAACGHGNEVVAIEFVERRDSCLCAYLHSVATGFGCQTVDDGMRVLREGEDALVVLYSQSDTVALEPSEGIVLRETFHQAFHQSVTTWVDGLQVAHLPKSVRAVTASSA